MYERNKCYSWTMTWLVDFKTINGIKNVFLLNTLSCVIRDLDSEIHSPASFSPLPLMKTEVLLS